MRTHLLCWKETSFYQVFNVISHFLSSPVREMIRLYSLNQFFHSFLKGNQVLGSLCL